MIQVQMLSKRKINIEVNEEILSFLKTYLDPYYNFVDKRIFKKNSEDKLIKVSYKSNDNVIDEIKNKINEKNYIKEIDIHYNQKIKVYSDMKRIIINYNILNHIIVIEQNSIHIWLNTSDPNYKYIPMRIIRDLDYVYLNNLGYHEVHSASISYKDCGLMIIGEGGAGKTTLLFRMIESGEFDFMSNDKTFLNSNNEILGFPYSINIYEEITEFIPMLHPLFENIESKHYQHVDWGNHFKNKKYTFSINDMKSYLNFGIKSSNKLKYIISPNQEVQEIKTLDKKSCIKFLKKNIRKSKFIEWLELISTEKMVNNTETLNMSNIKFLLIPRNFSIEDIVTFLKREEEEYEK